MDCTRARRRRSCAEISQLVREFAASGLFASEHPYGIAYKLKEGDGQVGYRLFLELQAVLRRVLAAGRLPNAAARW
ncbi:MAG: hypothetical protein MK538_09885 [Planctomycetes bacterium]|nr:hypothetical protein [Planctomycetota bacterium]